MYMARGNSGCSCSQVSGVDLHSLFPTRFLTQSEVSTPPFGNLDVSQKFQTSPPAWLPHFPSFSVSRTKVSLRGSWLKSSISLVHCARGNAWYTPNVAHPCPMNHSITRMRGPRVPIIGKNLERLLQVSLITAIGVVSCIVTPKRN